MWWDSDLGVVTIEYTSAIIDSDTAYDTWVAELRREFERCFAEAGGKYPLVVCIDELDIRPEFRDRYGQELAIEVADRWATAIARYGTRVGTRGVVASQALKRVVDDSLRPEQRARQYDANLFRTRESAIREVKRLAAASS